MLPRRASGQPKDRVGKTRSLGPQALEGLSGVRPFMSKSAKKPPLRELETTAVNAAMAAGRVIRKYFQGPISIREKQNASLVTNADVEAEQACVRVLLKK